MLGGAASRTFGTRSPLVLRRDSSMGGGNERTPCIRNYATNRGGEWESGGGMNGDIGWSNVATWHDFIAHTKT